MCARRRLLSLVTALAFLLAPLWAQAQSTATVRLKSGAIFKGELVEYVPEDHVTLKLATGAIKIFPHGQIANVKEDAASTPAPTATPTEIQVDVQANNAEAILFRTAPERAHLDGNLNGNLVGPRSKICAVPCRQLVPRGDYVVGGPGLRDTPAFELTGQSPSVRVVAEMGSDASLLGGAVLGGVGGLSALVGLSLLPFAFMPADSGGGGPSPSTQSSLKTASFLLLGAGVVAAVVGLSMVVKSQSHVQAMAAP